jgi:phosphoglycerol transferase MdoB-like AlkP superfamily enzyme
VALAAFGSIAASIGLGLNNFSVPRWRHDLLHHGAPNMAFFPFHQYGLELFNYFADERETASLLAGLPRAHGLKPSRVHKSSSPANRPNFLVVQVESLSACVVNRSLGGVEIMPFFNELSKRGAYFPSFYATPAAGHTSDAEFQLLTSLFPSAGEAAFVKYAFTVLPSLLKVLQGSGYHTYAAHGDGELFWNRRAMYRNLGFDRAKFAGDMPANMEHFGWGISDEAVFRLVAEDLRSLKAPFFALVVTKATHYPFSAFPFGSQVAVPSTGDTLADRYVQGARYIDTRLASFVADAQKSGALANTVLIVYGDHGSYTSICPEAGAATGGERVRRDFLTQRVPLVIVAPGMLSPRRIPGEAGHIDLTPTIAGLAGVEASPYWMGRDLLRENTADAVGVLDANRGVLLSKGLLCLATESRSSFASCWTGATGEPAPHWDSSMNHWLSKLWLSEALLETDFLRQVGDAPRLESADSLRKVGRPSQQ